MKTAITLCFAWSLVLSSTSFGAIVVNGGFEKGDFGDADFGWERAGIAGIAGSEFGIDPAGGSYQAVLQTGDSQPANLGELAAILRIDVADITKVAPDAFNGSAISQSIASVKAGDILAFDWNFITSESTGTKQDTAFFSVSRVGGPQQTFVLANPANATETFDETPYTLQSKYFNPNPYVPHLFTEAGDYFVGFGVVNFDDATFPSGLLIDNVTLTAVPEPTALAGLSLLGLTLTIRRRRRR